MRVIAERAFFDYYIVYWYLAHTTIIYTKFLIKNIIMSGNLIAITGLIYLWVAFDQGYNHKNIPMLITYIGYAAANVGLYMLANK